MLYICNIKPPKHGQDGSGNTNKSAPRPEQGRREIRRGGPYNPSRGAPAKAPRRGRPLASPRTSRYTACAPPGARPFPGTGSLKKAAWDAQANASRPKDAPEHHPHAPFGKGRQKSRQKENIDIVGKDKKDAPGFIQSHARMPETISSVNPGSAYPSQDYGNVSCAPHTPVWR